MAGHRSKGFTIVEIIVVIVILMILTTLVVVRLLSAQVGGRDQERAIDISAIATGLEAYYNNGNSILSIPKGYYPGATQINVASSTTPPFREFLEGVPSVSYIAPNHSIDDSFGIDPDYATSPVGANPDGSYSDAQARTYLEIYPYLYQPLKRNNTFCTNYVDCVKFNLYYLKEETDTVIKIRSIRQ